MVQTKRGAKVAQGGMFANIEADQSPVAPRGRWGRSSRATAEVQEAEDEINELQEMLTEMKAEKEFAKKRYEVALEAFDRDRKRAYAARRQVARGVQQEYLKSYEAYEGIEERVSRLQFQLFSSMCRTGSSDVNENPCEDFHRQPSPV